MDFQRQLNETIRFDKCAFGQRLRAFRLERNLTQKELSAGLDTTQSHIAMLEMGQRSPGATILTNLFVHFRPFYSYLLTGDHSAGWGWDGEGAGPMRNPKNMDAVLEENARYAHRIKELEDQMVKIQSSLQNSANALVSIVE